MSNLRLAFNLDALVPGPWRCAVFEIPIEKGPKKLTWESRKIENCDVGCTITQHERNLELEPLKTQSSLLFLPRRRGVTTR